MIDSNTFSLRIERLVSEKNLSYMDAIVYYCEKNDMEIETAAELINDKIKQMIALDANDLNLLKERVIYGKLPV